MILLKEKKYDFVEVKEVELVDVKFDDFVDFVEVKE